MNIEEIYSILSKREGELNSEEYGDYDSSELRYYKNNISDIRTALESRKIKAEDITPELLEDYINDGFSIPSKPLSDEIKAVFDKLDKIIEEWEEVMLCDWSTITSEDMNFYRRNAKRIKEALVKDEIKPEDIASELEYYIEGSPLPEKQVASMDIKDEMVTEDVESNHKLDEETELTGSVDEKNAYMNSEEIYGILRKREGELNSEEYSDYDSSELRYYKNNISDIKSALESGKIKAEDVTPELLENYINDGFYLPDKKETSMHGEDIEGNLQVENDDIDKRTVEEAEVTKLAEQKKDLADKKIEIEKLLEELKDLARDGVNSSLIE